MERVPENGSDVDSTNENSTDDIVPGKSIIKKKTRKRGIIYLSTVPPYMNVAKIREIFSEFGDVGRIYLQSSTSKFFEVMYFSEYIIVSGVYVIG